MLQTKSNNTVIATKPSIPKQKTKTLVTYETLLNVFFWFCLIFTIVDRFLWELWISLKHPFQHDAPLSQQIYQIVSWVSGRQLIVATSFLFFTQSRTTMSWFADHHPRWLHVGDIHATNNRLHRMIGKMTGFVVLLHVWLVFLPSIVDGSALIVISQSQRWKIPFYSEETDTVALATDDVWRLLEMTLLFGVAFPFSMWKRIKSGRQSRFSFAMIVHMLAGIMFAVDIIRKRSHPHSHVMFNLPVCVYWLLDRLYGFYGSRRGFAAVVHTHATDCKRYLVVFCRADKRTMQRYGDKACHKLIDREF